MKAHDTSGKGRSFKIPQKEHKVTLDYVPKIFKVTLVGRYCKYSNKLSGFMKDVSYELL